VVTKYHGDQINKNEFGLGKWHMWVTVEMHMRFWWGEVV